MNQWVVWFNVMSFSLMFVAFAFTYVGYLSSRKPWLRSYLLYLSTYAFWLLLLTYGFFRASYVPGEHVALDLGIGWTRVAVSLLMGYLAPLVVVQVEHGRASPRQLLLLGIVPLVTLAAVVVATTTRLAWLAVVLNVAFDGYLLAAAVWGAVALRKPLPDPRAGSLRAFFRISIVLYGLAMAYAVVGQIAPSTLVPASNAVTSGAFGYAWSILAILHQVRRSREAAADASSLPSRFVADYRITGRESEILRLLAEGMTTKEIGSKLCVSPRTVETHCQNVYRKCGVSNRVELLRLVDACRRA